eukprot:SAG31_NODE_1973_length_6757_cov_1.653950_4_plen_184_part_00
MFEIGPIIIGPISNYKKILCPSAATFGLVGRVPRGACTSGYSVLVDGILNLIGPIAYRGAVPPRRVYTVITRSTRTPSPSGRPPRPTPAPIPAPRACSRLIARESGAGMQPSSAADAQKAWSVELQEAVGILLHEDPTRTVTDVQARLAAGWPSVHAHRADQLPEMQPLVEELRPTYVALQHW